jgi:thiamine biosynthesis protein ThiS
LISIYLNGDVREVPEALTLASLMDWLQLPADRVAVERNLEVVPRNRWSETTIAGGDRLEVVHFVGGGYEDFSSQGCVGSLITVKCFSIRSRCARRFRVATKPA